MDDEPDFTPTPTPAPAPARRDHRSAPDAVWDAVRDDYLAGMSAPQACRRHGVGLSALRERAAREGWRRADQPWSPPCRLDPDDEGLELEAFAGGDLGQIDLGELAFVAQRRMMRAVLRGDAAEALRWRRVRQVLDEEEAEELRIVAQQAAIRAHDQAAAAAGPITAAAIAAAVAELYSPDGPDGPDGVFRPDP